MDAKLAGFADRLAVRERSTRDNLSAQSMEEAWAQFQSDWKAGIIFENFLADLADQINARCPQLEFIDTMVKIGAEITNFRGHPAVLSMVSWNGYWDSDLVVGPNIQYPAAPADTAGLTSREFVDRLPLHLNAIADKFVTFITEHGWNVCVRLELPEGHAPSARFRAPLRLIRHDVFIARFDMLGGKAAAIALG